MEVYSISSIDNNSMLSGNIGKVLGNPEIDVVTLYDEKKKPLQYNINRFWHKETYGFEMSKVEYEMHLSHRAGWQSFLDSDKPFACFLEKGVNIDFNDKAILEAISQLENDWDVFFPYDMFKHIRQSRVKDLSKMMRENIYLPDITEDDPYYLGFLWGSQVYFLSHKGVRILCNNTEIKQRVEDEIFFRTEFDGLQTYYDDFDWYDVASHINEVPKERLDNIRKAVLGYNVWDSRSVTLVRKMLKILSKLSLRCNIDLLLQAGSHLGFVRHGGIMPWDDDVDLGIHEDCIDSFLKELSMILELEVKLCFEGPKAFPYYKIWHKEGACIPEYNHKFPFIDLWLYRYSGDDLVFKNGITCKNSNNEDFAEVLFEGARLKIPSNSLDVLDSRYFDWRTSIRIYNWSHQNEQMSNFPLKTSIEVDENGRILI